MSQTLEVVLLGSQDGHRLDRIAPDVFDNPVEPAYVAEFLADPRHHIAVAVDGGMVVGFASGVHYLHPDKPPELFVNEVGVAPTHQRRGLAKAVLKTLLDHARSLGCVSAWVLTDRSNTAARALYGALGGGPMEGDAGDMLGFEFDLR